VQPKPKQPQTPQVIPAHAKRGLKKKGPRRLKKVAMTAEQLDREMEDYRAKAPPYELPMFDS